MKNKKTMIINKETAMRLWTKSFGKSVSTHDFAGRKIVKGAYNDRNSEFGWNVDHIFPQSKGGVTADYNLICCHIKTNDEKSARFPCFNANGLKFEIIKVQNHYEIKDVQKNVEKSYNLYDSADGIRLFEELNKTQNNEAFIGQVLIKLENNKSTALIDFIKNIFMEENVSFSGESRNGKPITVIQITNFNLSLREDISNLLDKCVLLNTYLASYFLIKKYLDKYIIAFQVNYYKNRIAMYSQSSYFEITGTDPCNGLFINYNRSGYYNYKQYDDNTTQYNSVYGKLKENLNKEANK